MDERQAISERQPTVIPVVAAGAPAGGQEQIKHLLSHIPTDTGTAFIVIQHLDPHHESQLTELLAHSCDLPVVTIEDQMPVQADRVHILPKDRNNFDHFARRRQSDHGRSTRWIGIDCDISDV